MRLIEEAARLRVDFTRRTLRSPLPGAIEALEETRSLGLKTGLVSDCSAEVPAVWPQMRLASLIDMPVFSCSARVRKPDPHIYLMACQRLNVSPEDCLYVGDGAGQELTGAGLWRF